jgi:hypothetical protein
MKSGITKEEISKLSDNDFLKMARERNFNAIANTHTGRWLDDALKRIEKRGKQ